jgi:ribose/xylose/arabinose/galactoside ABC-type transport system permease subunit
MSPRTEGAGLEPISGSDALARPSRAAEGSPLTRFIGRHALWPLLLVLVVAAEIVSHGAFLQPRNLINILAQNSVAGTLAIGQTLVILTGGIDLSLGSVTALSSLVLLLLQDSGALEARLASLGVGLACGLLNGSLVTIGLVPAFIATLGMMQGALGLAFVVSGGYPIYESDHMAVFGELDQIGPIPLIVMVWLTLAVAAWIFLSRTRFGAYIYAIGGNERAARVSGVRTTRTKLLVYTIAGGCASIAGVILVNRLGYTQPTIGGSFTLDSIAPVVVGGTSLFGGVGGIWRTVGGVLVMGTLNNLMVLMGVNIYIEQVVQGIVVLAVVYSFIRVQRSQFSG